MSHNNQYLDEASLSTSIEIILDPQSWIRRIEESVRIRNESVTHHILLELGPVDVPQRVLVPLLRPRRGQLIDNFSIHQTSDNYRHTINRVESEYATAAILREAAVETLAEAGLDPSSVHSRAILDIVVSVVYAEPSDGVKLANFLEGLSEKAPDQARILAAIQQLGTNVIDPANGEGLEWLLQFLALASSPRFLKLLQYLQYRRLLLTPVDLTVDGTSISFEYELGLDKVAHRMGLDTLRDWFGFAPYDLRFEVPLALRTTSYHFVFRAPRGQYVRLQEFWRLRFMSHETRSHPLRPWDLMSYFGDKSGDPICQGYGTNVTEFSHLYIGSQSDHSKLNPLYVHLVVNERPLGSMAATLLKVLSTLLITSTAWILGPKLLATGNAGSFAIPLLIALPGIFSLGSLVSSAKDDVDFTPMASRFGVFIAGMSSVVAALLFLWWSTDDVTVASDRFGYSVTAWYFAVLSIQLIMAVWLAVRLIVNVVRFVSARRNSSRVIDKVTI